MRNRNVDKVLLIAGEWNASASLLIQQYRTSQFLEKLQN
jgi:hypothetical protein